MLSIVVNVKNGERYLEQCLKSLAKFEDVVLLDNYSTDNTIEIAKSFSNVNVQQCPFQGMGKVRNIAASYAKNDWVFFVDCDEVLEPTLVDVLLNYKFQRGNIYNIYRKNYYDQKSIETSSWGNDWIKRLYNRQDTSFAENEVHDNFIDKLPNVKIHGGSMLHFPYECVEQLINKMQFYSTLYARQHYNKKFPKLWTIPFRAFLMFLKCYVLKRGFLDGYEGFVISSYNAMGVFSKYIKLYELYYKKNIGLALHIQATDSINDINMLFKFINNQTLLPSEVVIIHDVNYDIKSLESALINLVPKYRLLTLNQDQDRGELIKKYVEADINKLSLLYVLNNKLLENKHYFLQSRACLIKKRNLFKGIIYSSKQ